MTSKAIVTELKKDLRRRLDQALIDAKRARKSYDQRTEAYHDGQTDAIRFALGAIERLEGTP